MSRQYDLFELSVPLGAGCDGEADDGQGDVRACRVLPFVAVPAGTSPPEGCNIVPRKSNYPFSRLALLQGIDFLIATRVDVINLSFGFIGVFDPDEPLQRATRLAGEHGIIVVVAAGNEGPAEASLQELALAPWVISVGATDPAGQLLACSSRGSPSSSGPTVVADGTDDSVPKFSLVVDFRGKGPGEQPDIKKPFARFPPGTSFAAPRVAWAAVLAQKILDVSSKVWAAALAADNTTVPIALPVLGIVDTGIDPDFLPDDPGGPIRRQLDREWLFEATDAEHAWCIALANRFKDWNVSLNAPGVNMETVRRALTMLARPVSGKGFEVGAGRVSLAIASDFFAAFTPSRLAAVFLSDNQLIAAVPPDQLKALDAELGPLWSAARIKEFTDVFTTGMLLAVAKGL